MVSNAIIYINNESRLIDIIKERYELIYNRRAKYSY